MNTHKRLQAIWGLTLLACLAGGFPAAAQEVDDQQVIQRAEQLYWEGVELFRNRFFAEAEETWKRGLTLVIGVDAAESLRNKFLNNLSVVKTVTGDWESAIRAAIQAQRDIVCHGGNIGQRIGHEVHIADTTSVIGFDVFLNATSLFLEMGDPEQALASIAMARDTVQVLPVSHRKLGLLGLLAARAYVQSGSIHDALSEIRLATELLRETLNPVGLASLLLFEGRLLRETGDLIGAAKFYQDALEQLPSLPQTMSGSNDPVTALNEEGALASARSGSAQQSLEYATMAKGRALAGELVDGVGQLSSSTITQTLLADVRTNLQEIVAQIHDQADNTVANDGMIMVSMGVPGISTDASRDQSQATDSLRDIVRELAERDPALALNCAFPRFLFSDLQQVLQPGEVVIDYLLLETEALANVATIQGVTAVALMHTGREIDKLAGEFQTRREEIYDFVRQGERMEQDELIAGLRHRKALAEASLARLVDMVWEPVRDYVNDATRIIIVPDGLLALAPFQIFLVDGKYLIEQYEFVYAPTVYDFVLARRKPRLTEGAPVIVARSDFAHERSQGLRVGDLPGAIREAEMIAAVYDNDAVVLLGDQATEEAVRRKMTRCRVLHLATHAQFLWENPWKSYILLAADANADGKLEAQEIYNSFVDSQLVILSACQTGVRGIRRGADDEPLPAPDLASISRSFVRAGCPNTLATLWSVLDEPTTRIMVDTHAGIADGLDPTRALRQAQLAWLHQLGEVSQRDQLPELPAEERNIETRTRALDPEPVKPTGPLPRVVTVPAHEWGWIAWGPFIVMGR